MLLTIPQLLLRDLIYNTSLCDNMKWWLVNHRSDKQAHIEYVSVTSCTKQYIQWRPTRLCSFSSTIQPKHVWWGVQWLNLLLYMWIDRLNSQRDIAHPCLKPTFMYSFFLYFHSHVAFTSTTKALQCLQFLPPTPYILMICISFLSTLFWTVSRST